MSNKENIVIDISDILTTSKLYNNVYYRQLLEINRLAFGFLISSLFLKIVEHTILDQFKDNNVMYVSILIVLTVAIMYIAVKVFTYIKISNEKDELLKKLTT